MTPFKVMCNLCDKPPILVGKRKTKIGAVNLRNNHIDTVRHKVAAALYTSESVRILAPV